MSAPHVILCGGAPLSSTARRWADVRPIKLSIGTGKRDVHLKSGDIPARLFEPLSSRALDLLEIAAFVFTADQAASRGGDRSFEYGQSWRRNFRFEIPVRDLAFWRSNEVVRCLSSTLGFLSDDDYEFAFTRNASPAASEAYLPFSPGKPDAAGVEEVMLFSGGLDSFCGAVQEIAVGQRRVALVSHVSSTKVGKPQRDLVTALSKNAAAGRAPLHIPVTLNKGKALTVDNTQRTRSFVFAAMAGIVARAIGLDRIRFYENGTVSFNLPITGELVGGRASRTTHPRTIKMLRELLTLVFGVPFEIENPFLWRTRADIMEQLKSSGLSSHCAKTISCAHTKERTTQHSHCGRCSQCIDRRFAALAAQMSDDEDPAVMYAASLDTPCRDELHRTLIERYIGTVLRLRTMTSAQELMAQVGEVARTLSSLPGPAASVAEQVFALHKRHADQVHGALVGLVRGAAQRLVDGDVPHESPLGIVLRLAPRLAEGTAAPLAAIPPSSNEPPKTYATPTADRETFTARFREASCPLGNTVEFRFFERLARKPGVFVSIERLLEDVWEGNVRGKNTVHKCASNLRRLLSKHHLDGLLSIDGKQRGHYAMQISADGKN